MASLGRMLHGTPIQQILVILDTCYAGRGVADFGSVAQEHINALRPNDQVARGFYAMAAARPKEEARQGVFAQALVDTLEDPPLQCGGDQQKYLGAYEFFIETINQKFKTLTPETEGKARHVQCSIRCLVLPQSSLPDCAAGARPPDPAPLDPLSNTGVLGAVGRRSRPSRAGISPVGLRS